MKKETKICLSEFVSSNYLGIKFCFWSWFLSNISSYIFRINEDKPNESESRPSMCTYTGSKCKRTTNCYKRGKVNHPFMPFAVFTSLISKSIPIFISRTCLLSQYERHSYLCLQTVIGFSYVLFDGHFSCLLSSYNKEKELFLVEIARIQL